MNKLEIKAIEERLESSSKWNVLIMQSDVRRLLDEVKRLRKENKSFKKKKQTHSLHSSGRAKSSIDADSL